MTYRDDHEAALARLDAVQRELDAARADDSKQAETIRALERALGEARAERDRAERALAERKPPEPPKPAAAASESTTPPEVQPRTGAGVLVALVLCALAIGALFAIGRASSNSAHEPAVTPRPAQPVIAALPDETSRLIDEAIARARQKLAGGYLSEIDITAIDQQGKVHPEYEGALMMRFYRQRPITPPPARPIGAPEPPGRRDDGYDCLQLAKLPTIGSDWTELGDDLCHLTEILPSHHESRPPACTPTAIWALARRDGAPDGALAHLRYDGSWRFEIRDNRSPFAQTYEDNCSASVPGR